MGIVDEDIARVRAATDFVAVAASTSRCNGSGDAGSGLCPFHAEKTPSFSVNGEEGSTTASAARPRATSSLRPRDRAPRLRRRRRAAGRQGRHHAALHRRRGEGEGRKRRSALVEAIEQAVDWYHERLLLGARRRGGPAATCARGATTATRCGRSRSAGRPTTGTSWPGRCRLPDDVVARHRPRVPQPAQPPAGLLPRPGAVPDLRRAAAMPVGVRRARCCPAADGPEVQELARDAALLQEPGALRAQLGEGATSCDADEVIVCEGYTDVIGFAARRHAPRGGHVRHGADRGARPLLKNFARRVVLAFDADAAGQAAAERFYEWERTLRDRRRGGRAARRASTRPTWPAPTPSALRAAVERGHARSSGSGVDRVLAARRPAHRPRAGPGPPRRRWPSIREHPERPRARPVRHGGRRPDRASTPTGCGRGCARCVRAPRATSAPARARRERRRQRPEIEALRLGRAPPRGAGRAAARRPPGRRSGPSRVPRGRCSPTRSTWPPTAPAGVGDHAARRHRGGRPEAAASCSSGWRSRSTRGRADDVVALLVRRGGAARALADLRGGRGAIGDVVDLERRQVGMAEAAHRGAP